MKSLFLFLAFSASALAVDPVALLEARDETLRAWLRAAPPVGTLS